MLFVSKPRCASNYITDALGFSRSQYHEKAKHMRAGDLCACVRHPYTLLVSWYAYHSRSPRLTEQERDFYKKYVNISQWIESGCPTHWQQADFKRANKKWDLSNPLHQKPWVDGRNVYIIRYETLDSDLERLALKNGLTIRTSSAFRNESDTHGVVLSDADKLKVYTLFREDFIAFAYER